MPTVATKAPNIDNVIDSTTFRRLFFGTSQSAFAALMAASSMGIRSSLL